MIPKQVAVILVVVLAMSLASCASCGSRPFQVRASVPVEKPPRFLIEDLIDGDEVELNLHASDSVKTIFRSFEDPVIHSDAGEFEMADIETIRVKRYSPGASFAASAASTVAAEVGCRAIFGAMIGGFGP